MAVRPFYIEADIEGRNSNLSGGPMRKDGTMFVRLKQRDQGGITDAFIVRCTTDTDENGKLLLTTSIIDGDTKEVVARKTTEY